MLDISRVTVNYLDDPMGINGALNFGWVINSDRCNVQ
jgi:hypothetical protein